jgi:hypothetical protein
VDSRLPVLTDLDNLLVGFLIVLGVGFLVVNVRFGIRFSRYLRLRRSAILTWPPTRPRFYALQLAFPLVFTIVIIVKLVVWRMPPINTFGEFMMLVYYGYVLPLSMRIGRGLYETGLWLEDGFVPYSKVGRIAWREGPPLTLLVMPRMRALAHRLEVPQRHYGEVRRLLRDRIAEQRITLGDKSLDLGSHDQRDDV